MNYPKSKQARIIKQLSEAIKSKPSNYDLLIKEVHKLTPLMEFPKAKQNIYSFSAHESPILMEEIGRLRENCWRFYGYGTGKKQDIDFYDTNVDSCYRQLFSWDTDTQEILGGCRYVSMIEMQEQLKVVPPIPQIHTFEIFDASELFLKTHLPKTLELQRVFVLPRMDSNLLNMSVRHTPHVLDNLFRALGKNIISKQKIEYVTGRATFPPALFSKETIRKMIQLFHNNISRYDLLLPKESYQINVEEVQLPRNETLKTYQAPPAKRISLLQKEYSGKDVPIILKIYLNLSDVIYFFGGLRHPELDDSVEAAIMVSTKDFFPKKRDRYFTDDFIQYIENSSADSA